MTRIVVDIYGADAGPTPVLEGVTQALKLELDFYPILVGQEALITAFMDGSGIAPSRYEVMDTAEFISPCDPPHCIFGGRDDSSMAIAYGRLKSDEDCCAMLSAGNTGALLVGAMCRLGLVPGLKFPALLTLLPCAGERLICMVDCGANMDCKAQDLVRFATMGSAFCRCYCGTDAPKVGLMNVGTEPGKGNALAKEAYTLLSETDLNFIGNLEGGDTVTGKADVIVCDGFCGNVLLKNTEAAGKAALAIMERAGANMDPAILEAVRSAVLKAFDFNSQGAAVFLGTRKTVVKMHGCATNHTTVAAIRQILRMERAGACQSVCQAYTETLQAHM